MAEQTLKAKITADSKDYVKGMEQAEEATEEFTESVGKTSSKSDDTTTKLAKLAAKATALRVALKTAWNTMEKGIEYNSSMEQYQTSFEVMTGSAEKAKSVVEELQKTAAETPFEMPQLAETTQLLMNYGLTADDSISKMKMLGDIAQGDAEKLSRIAMAYGQMSSAGKVSLEDIKQMIEAGFNPLQEISETTGESMASLYDRISKGTIAVDEITDSMIRSTSEGGKYFGSMSAQSQTLEGRMSTLGDAFGSFMGERVEPLSNFLRDDLLPGLTYVLENFEKYEPVLVALGIAVGTLTLAYVANTLGITTLTGATGIWAGVSSIATTATTALSGAMAFLTTEVGMVILAIGAAIAIGYLLIKHWDEVKTFAVETWDKITNAFTEFDLYLTGEFSKDLTESFGWFGNVLNAFFHTTSQIWNSSKQICGGFVDFVAGVFTGNWQRAWQGVVNIFGGIFGGMTAIAKAPINGVISLVNAAIGGLNKLSIKIPDWVPVFGGASWGVNLPKIPYLLHGTDNWIGGFARMNEGGRGELTYLPNGTQVIPHDISVKYAKESARANNSTTYVHTNDIDYNAMSNAMVKAMKYVKIILNEEEVGQFFDDRLLEVL